jgi:hypothetical protein
MRPPLLVRRPTGEEQQTLEAGLRSADTTVLRRSQIIRASARGAWVPRIARQAVRGWIRAHNRRGQRAGQGGRILPCSRPIQSPWLNPIEPTWAPGKRRVVELARLRSADEVTESMPPSPATMDPSRHSPQCRPILQ